MNEVVLVKPAYFKETGNVQTFDKNNKPNVILIPVAGKMPKKAMVLAGTVAISNGILGTDGAIAGTLQLVLVNETEQDATYGRQFSVTLLDHDVNSKEVLGFRKELGEALVIDVTKVVEPKKEEEPKDAGKTPLISSGLGNNKKVGP